MASVFRSSGWCETVECNWRGLADGSQVIGYCREERGEVVSARTSMMERVSGRSEVKAIQITS